MKLGAQFYSICTECETPEALKKSFAKIKDIGYENVQISCCCEIEAERLKSFSDEYALPIVCTHRGMDEIVNDTENMIKYHKTIACPVIGIGSMPTEYRNVEGFHKFIEEIRTPLRKITDAGLTFAYHNHHFEFYPLEDGTIMYDVLLEELPEMHLIHDVYWSRYAGVDTFKYIKRICKDGRMTNIHYKDMLTEPEGDICPCGKGVTDFKALTELCSSLGIENALVEQDNAPDLGDPFEQMKMSFEHLYPIINAYR